MKIDLKTNDRQIQQNVSGSAYVKVTCILMLHKGFSPEDVSDSLGIDSSTVCRYAKKYLKEGIDNLLQNNYHGYFGLLSSTQLSLLRSELKSQVYTTAKSVADWICINFGVTYTSAGIVDLLNRIGFSYKKTKEIPCECDIEKQEKFVEELAGIFKNQDEDTLIYYADGVHPTHNSRSTYAWIEKGEEFEQPTVSGRDRVNINGLVNARDVTDIIALDSNSINAQSTQELYEKVLEKHPKAKKIIIISDNARYYKNRHLKEWLMNTRITQLFLPPYSPNLNLIERLWKFLRKKVINTHFYRTKEEFRKSVMAFFENIEMYKSELQTLLTLNFRLTNSQSISF